ncbi:MAG: hypothetical protein ACRENG_01520 [bacterium]
MPQEIKEPSWHAHEYFFNRNKILLNGFASTGKLWIAGVYSFAEFDTARAEQPILYLNWVDIPLSSKPAISKDFYAYPYPTGDALVIRANAFPVDPEGNLRFSLSAIDSSFSPRARIAADNYRHPVGAFNQSGQLLFAVIDSSEMNVCLNQLKSSGPFPRRLEVTSTRRIHLAGYDYVCYDIEWFHDRFLVGTWKGAYLVYPTGEFKAIFSRHIYEFFAFHDTLYALSGAELYRSADLGDTWQLYATNFPIWYARFFEVRSKLCFYVGSQMAELEVGTGRIRELDNFGLETNEITSVSEFYGKVYVATLSGLFYRDAKGFFTYKEETTSQRLNTTAMVVQ